MEQEVLIGIPSEAQMGYRNHPGSFNISFEDIGVTGWLSDADTMSKYHGYGYTNRMNSDHTRNIIPVIKIKDDAPVDIDEHGQYIIRIPESTFDGDIMAFLGYKVSAAA
jgi:hypothetical protein